MARLRRAERHPLRAAFGHPAAGGVALMVAAACALVWANSPWRAGYHELLRAPVAVGAGWARVSWPLVDWVNDALMTLFFLLAGLEIKRELVVGELRTARRAALPLVAAAGGMVVPALVYLAVNPRGPGRAGWGIPMATDIAFALGCLGLIRARVPRSLFVFLTALAIFDDLGAIVVIALFYGRGVHWPALGVAATFTVALVAAGRARAGNVSVFALLGALLWAALLHSGVHAALAGVIVGLSLTTHEGDRRPSPLARVERALGGVVAFFVLPAFALANAGVELAGGASPEAVRVTAGVSVGLALGKMAGVFGATTLAVKWGLAPRPTGATWLQVFGVAIMAGVGFTMSIFVSALAFSGPSAPLDLAAKKGIAFASAGCASLAIALLYFAGRPIASGRPSHSDR